jgi:phosphosulfolactate synthase
MKSSKLNADWNSLIESRRQKSSKPRVNGMTMILEKSIGESSIKDLAESSGSYIDFIKFSFGTPLLIPASRLKKITAFLRKQKIESFVGGSSFEISYSKKRYSQFLENLGNIGFCWIEISDGMIELSPKQRKLAIQTAKESGFKVITEVGKKDPSIVLKSEEIVEQIKEDFENGAELVIIEARESGRGVGIFDTNGTPKEKIFETIIGGLDVIQLESLIWEAPLKDQQVFLIKKLGNHVNLGNIQPGDALGLEALRRGWRWDTFR